ncbi:probable LRR receptor-like serine/threonine-protein kinase At4g36180 [Papaver somniferum]|uniref:probable LRR receptor-like serine/threonine-protein kinase At4g36180 n=1 Tax=Papaver somniferum TaxID=3469 RepID=UPI000E6FC141|nr:probable LRR receptor-like serine/threonine-protein kinase At4g36180 [Papaver somniferum]
MSHNNLTGVIPSCISKLQNLDSSFDVSNNKLCGEISAEIGVTLSDLEVLNLAGNEFSGSIPSSICSNIPIYSSSTIDLSNNKFSGVIPNTIGNCRNLESLNLGNNSLKGNVPNEIGQLHFLNYLQLQDNYLEGTITFISKFPDLDVLNLANNHFQGNIPRALFGPQHPYVRIISLRSNKLNGSLPNEISLSHLLILDLSHNQLSGHIPTKLGRYWMNLPSYSSVQLTDQRNDNDIQLQMVINGIMVQFQKVYPYDSVLDLSCNMFEGNIPTEIGRSKGLRRLNLSHNHLSGNLPVSIADMSNLVSLDLSFNTLSGQIPHSLTSLDSLGFLNLSYNELSGKIPRGTHFDTLGVDGWAFVGNALLCGEPTKKVCEVEEDDQNDDQEDASEKLIFYSIVFLGFVVGFWGPFLVMLIKRDKMWFLYWKFIDYFVVVIIRCIQNK